MTNEGEVIIPAQVPKHDLHQLREQHSFLCMQCKEKVILKIGSILIPHFAHQKNSSCSHSFSEGETEDHLNGKLQLFTFFQQKLLECELESFLPEIKQRPDILVQSNGIPYAIEFQCSNISSFLMLNRTKGYVNNQITPIWLLKSPTLNEFPTREIGKMQLSAFRQNFFTVHPKYGKMILTYCPQTKKFYYISNPLHIRANTYIVKVKKLDIEKQTWPFAVVKSIASHEFQSYLNIYKEERVKHLSNLYYYNKFGVQSPFLRICYRWQMHPKHTPLFIGIPTPFAEAFQVHAVEWQIALLDYLYTMKVSINQVSKKHCESFLYARSYGGEKIKEKVKAVTLYIKLLKKCVIREEDAIWLSTIDLPKMNTYLYSEFLAKGAEY